MVYLVGCNSVRNEQRRDNNARILAGLKQQYGENWEKGVDADSTVERYSDSSQRRRREEKERMDKERKDASFKHSIKESIKEVKGFGHGKQLEKLERAVDNV